MESATSGTPLSNCEKQTNLKAIEEAFDVLTKEEASEHFNAN